MNYRQTYLAITGIMEASIRGKHQKTTSVFSPSDSLLADNRLHNGIEATFRGIQITRHCSSPYLSLCCENRKLIISI